MFRRPTQDEMAMIDTALEQQPTYDELDSALKSLDTNVTICVVGVLLFLLVLYINQMYTGV